MVSVIHNESEITTWMGYSFILKQNEHKTQNLKQQSI